MTPTEEALITAILDHPQHAPAIAQWARDNPDALEEMIGESLTDEFAEGAGFSGIITDKRGRKRKYQDGKPVPMGGGDAPAAPDSGTVEEKAAKNPRFKVLLGAVAGAVRGAVDTVIEKFATSAEDILIVANDYAKITADRLHDPISAATGIGAYDAGLIASHVLSRLYLAGKKRLGFAEVDPGEAAGHVLEILRALHQAWGVPDAPLPDIEEVAAKIAEKLGNAPAGGPGTDTFRGE